MCWRIFERPRCPPPMQPVFEITGDRLLEAAAVLEELDGDQIQSSPWVRLWLFLCGLQHSVRIVSESMASDCPRPLAPQQLPDDRLERAAQMLVRQLVKEAKSRSTSSILVYATGMGVALGNEKFRRLALAFTTIDPLQFAHLRAWITRGDLRENLIRLSFAAGVIAYSLPPSGSDFFIPMMKAKMIKVGRQLPPEKMQQLLSVFQSFATAEPSP